MKNALSIYTIEKELQTPKCKIQKKYMGRNSQAYVTIVTMLVLMPVSKKWGTWMPRIEHNPR